MNVLQGVVVNTLAWLGAILIAYIVFLVWVQHRSNGRQTLQALIKHQARSTARFIGIRRQCVAVCKLCTTIDYKAECQRIDTLKRRWQRNHPLGPLTQEDHDEWNALIYEEVGTYLAMYADLDQKFNLDALASQAEEAAGWR